VNDDEETDDDNYVMNMMAVILVTVVWFYASLARCHDFLVSNDYKPRVINVHTAMLCADTRLLCSYSYLKHMYKCDGHRTQRSG
jgi:hypothetical protein